jgi:hypothetical protein
MKYDEKEIFWEMYDLVKQTFPDMDEEKIKKIAEYKVASLLNDRSQDNEDYQSFS